MASVPPTGIAARVLPGSKSVSLDYVPSGAGAVPAPLGKFSPIAARVLPGSKSVSLDYVPSGAGAVPAPLGKFCNCKVSRSFSKLQVQLAAGPEDCPSCPLSIRDKTR